MNGPGLLELAVGVAVMIAACVAVTVRDRLTSVVTFVLFGGLLALVWAGLRAPDVALAEAAIGTGVTGALLVDAAATRRAPEAADRPGGTPGRPPTVTRKPSDAARPGRVPLVARAAAVVLGAGFVVLLVRAVLATDAGQHHPPLTGTVDDAMPDTATGHEITAVLLDFRAYDTLLEVAVILVAVVGAFALAAAVPARVAGERPAPVPAPDSLRDFLRLASPLLLLLAAWLLFAGTYRPGGAFQGGAALAGAAILAVLAGVPASPLYGIRGRWLAAVGPAAFLAAGALGLLTAGHWLAMPAGWEEAATIAVETAITVSIGAGLTLLFLAVRRGTDRIGDAPPGGTGPPHAGADPVSGGGDGS